MSAPHFHLHAPSSQHQRIFCFFSFVRIFSFMCHGFRSGCACALQVCMSGGTCAIGQPWTWCHQAELILICRTRIIPTTCSLDCLTECYLVLNPAGMPRKNGMTCDNLFESMLASPGRSSKPVRRSVPCNGGNNCEPCELHGSCHV